jgi:hypothetical protein
MVGSRKDCAKDENYPNPELGLGSCRLANIYHVITYTNHVRTYERCRGTLYERPERNKRSLLQISLRSKHDESGECDDEESDFTTMGRLYAPTSL